MMSSPYGPVDSKSIHPATNPQLVAVSKERDAPVSSVVVPESHVPALVHSGEDVTDVEEDADVAEIKHSMHDGADLGPQLSDEHRRDEENICDHDAQEQTRLPESTNESAPAESLLETLLFQTLAKQSPPPVETKRQQATSEELMSGYLYESLMQNIEKDHLS